MLRDLGVDLPIRLWTDFSAAIGICSRQGLGKLRHLDTHTLWIQQAVRIGRADLRKGARGEEPIRRVHEAQLEPTETGKTGGTPRL